MTLVPDVYASEGISADVHVYASLGDPLHRTWADVLPVHPARSVLMVAEIPVDASAGAMDSFSSAARAIARLDLPPWWALSQLDAVVADTIGLPVHLSYIALDAMAGEAVMAQAGALPPVFVSPNGRAHAVPVDVTAPLGLAGRTYSDSVCALPWGATLVLRNAESLGSANALTSGLAARQQGGSGGRALSVTAGRSVQQAAQRIVATRNNGAMIVVLSRQGTHTDIARRRFPVISEAPRLARRFVDRTARKWHVDHDALTLVVGEAVANVVRHTTSAVIDLRLGRLADGVLVEVHDASAALPQRRKTSWLDSSGRGLSVIAESSRSWGARWVADGKVVWAHVGTAR